MGCVSSTLLRNEDDFSQIGASTAFGHHIVSLTSTTYGLLTLDSPPPPSSSSSSDDNDDDDDEPSPTTPPLKPDDVINSWELMAGLDSSSTPSADHSFRFPPPPSISKENYNPNLPLFNKSNALISQTKRNCYNSLDGFEKLCPPNGENKVVIYTTTLRGIRSTFEACNAVRSAINDLDYLICERDISMDRGFREELRELMNKGSKDKKSDGIPLPPRVFVKGRYIGGVEEVMRIAEDGALGNLLSGLPKLMRAGHVCEGCGGVRFLPCFQCNGSCKVITTMEHQRTMVVRCSDCNENGLVLCPICT
ncbi:hypothetical protein ACH5RR_041839 [Cinchona calisaya]|uniref:Glutaredoxin domain-containing protein n=1 Tax=Cinchona calisaya TaxID=153742 RepID=A0ABD2XUM9_9GENT